MKNIIVLGSGSAGLITAITLKKAFPEYSIKVIESDSVGIIGVGESTTEHLKNFINYTEIDVGRLVRETDATLKKGIKFENWNGDNKSYFHSLDNYFYSPTSKVNAMQALIANDIKTYDVLADTNLVQYNGGLYQANQYQFNTVKLNKFLHDISTERNIEFIKATICDVTINSNGDVEQLISEDGTRYLADFFIDSSGFSRVISSKLGAKWNSYSKYLPMNHAIAFPTQDISDLKPYTLCRALGSGWNWRIATQGRYGNGYVFCDTFINATKAYDEVQSFYKEEIVVAKDIKFEAGRLDKFWINNCISTGLSSSFVEPLEATSIGNAILQVFALIKLLPAWEVDRKVADSYNEEFIKSFNNIVDFVQLHYITKRNDTEFWKSLPSMMEHTDFVKENLELFRKTLPIELMFKGDYLMFRSANWAQVMAGLELYDTSYIKQKLINTIGDDGIKNHLDDYNIYLNAIEKTPYMEHAVLLQQNRIIVKLDRS